MDYTYDLVGKIQLVDVRWRRLDIDNVIETGDGYWVDYPDLSKVEEIGFTDLMRGAGHGSAGGSRLDWIEVYGKPVPRKWRSDREQQSLKNDHEKKSHYSFLHGLRIKVKSPGLQKTKTEAPNNSKSFKTRATRAPAQAFVPPSTVRFAPVIYEDSGPATNATSAATSSTCP